MYNVSGILYESCNQPRDALTCYLNASRSGAPNRTDTDTAVNPNLGELVVLLIIRNFDIICFHNINKRRIDQTLLKYLQENYKL